MYSNEFTIDEMHNPIDYRDKERKEVGDRVQVIDYSSATHVDGSDLSYEDYEGLDHEMMFIVIEDRLRVKFNTPAIDFIQDLIIVNLQTKIQYRIISGHVKLI